MKKIIVLLMVTCLVLPFVQDANAFGKKKKKKMPTEQTTLVRPPVKKNRSLCRAIERGEDRQRRFHHVAQRERENFL